MKHNKIITLALLGLAMASLAGCKGSGKGSGDSDPKGGGISYQTGDKIYTKRILFDTSAETVVNPSFRLKNNKEVTDAKLGRANLTFGTKDGVITFKGQEFVNAGPGEKNITVTFADNTTEKIETLLANKFIYTAQDFQSINNELTGIYVLAQDVDFSEMDNFEPLGTMGDEQDPTNSYFHGVLDGDGFALKNLTCSYSDSPKGPHKSGTDAYPSNYDVFTGDEKFTDEHHIQGDNIGVFQTVGKSGIVRNLVFDNVRVHGRTIVGIIAANVQGTVENCLVRSNCKAEMDTHYYDDDCNVGAAFGIVAGDGRVSNIISLTKNVSILDIYQDYNNDYKGQTGNGWDHGTADNINDPFWRFCGVNREVNGAQYLDTNGQKTNGVYSVVGKCWGSCVDCVGSKFSVQPMSGDAREVCFGHTHAGNIKPTSGDGDMGEFVNCGVFSNSELKRAETYANFDTEVWNIQDGSAPSMKKNVNTFEIAQ